ncbi:MAG: YggS family pyridoxal phosphate-dependent enzyme [Moraxellaceae bacterium]|nr:YggS family pyridoxal phosphate-dependent enzyme [Moraxellaceae bacterium]MDZ4386362.1 YggS family pyridoxal phosphate-dependent enzyme [Moraxellaceae bacterium]
MTGHDETALIARWQQVQQQITQAEKNADRPAGSVQLLAVSKLHSAEAIRCLYQAGQRCFAENYVQEALGKMQALHDLSIEWHLIGPLQSNKTREVAEHFAWVHSVDRLKIAQRLSAQRPDFLPPLNICLQVNIDDEDSKSGCSLEDLPALAEAVLELPNISLRGLMCIPQAGNQHALAALAKTHSQLVARLPALTQPPFDTLSMGMSDDLAAAIAAGSTMVRIGTAIFGERVSTN